MSEDLWNAAMLGVVEGLTEFIPVSSTGHLILLVDRLGFRGPPGKVFEVAIQLGAIFAICWVYRTKLWNVAISVPTRPDARRFVVAIFAAFLPAAVIGYIMHDFIKTVLFSPYVVAISLVLGGLAILVIERKLAAPRISGVESIGVATALKIGLCQATAIIPGVSRSGATIMGALLLGVDRRTATEFSFFVAIPTMLGATTLDLHKNWGLLNMDDGLLIGIGFTAACLAALVVVRSVVAFVGRHGFVPFAWYRITLGTGILVLLFASK